uniref:Dimer_Tnp_hAT domain-containing protein n=1 Tax=Strongyloides papillosus TaxID=174720 RepID=A0A0N5B8V6_STREA
MRKPEVLKLTKDNKCTVCGIQFLTSNTNIYKHCMRHASLRKIMKEGLDRLTYENARISARCCSSEESSHEEEILPKINGTSRANLSKKRKLNDNVNSFSIVELESKKRNETFRKYLLKYIIGAGLPFSIVENKQFMDLVNFVSNGSIDSLPSRKTVVKNIDEMYNYYLNELKQKIMEKFVSLTTDEWSNREFKVTVITISYINENDEIEKKIYSVNEVSPSTKDKDLAEHLVNSFNKINLSMDKIVSITTDGASNMRLLCKQLECFNIPSLSHILNLIIKTSVEKQQTLKELINRIINSVIKCKKAKKFPIIKLKRKFKLDCKTRWNLLAEMLRLLVRYENDFKEFTTTEYILIKAILEIFQTFEKYTLLSDNSNICDYIPILFKLRDEVQSINANFANLLSNNENNNINYIVKGSEGEKESEDFLSEIEDSSDIDESYFNNDYDDVPDECEQEIVTEIDEIKDITLSSLATIYELFKKNILEKIDIRINQSMKNELLLKALYLNPNECYRKKYFEMKKWEELSIIVCNSKNKENQYTIASPNAFNNDRFIPTNLQNASFSENNNYLCHVRNISSEVNIDHFWNSVKVSTPHLHSLYQKFRIIKSTSIKSESAFSILSYIRNCRHSSLTTRDLNNLLVLRDNLNYIM